MDSLVAREPTRHLVIRADASGRIGAGHVMRCVALAEAWREIGAEVVFALAEHNSLVGKVLLGDGIFAVERIGGCPGSEADASQTSALVKRLGADWVVIDGYHFDASYQETLSSSGCKVLVVDDYGHAAKYAADMVLNQNLHADASLYRPTTSQAELLLGPRYALLRSEFQRIHSQARVTPDVARKLLVTLGGRPPTARLKEAASILRHVDVTEVHALFLGAGSRTINSIRRTLSQDTWTVRAEENWTGMARRMEWADAAISAGGTTTWELACSGVPACLFCIAENQAESVRLLDQAGVACGLGRFGDLPPREAAGRISAFLKSKETRLLMSQNGRRVVDGLGAKRVLMRQLATSLRLRLISQDDCGLLWAWANDPSVRAASFRHDPISWEEHVEWFRTKLSSPVTRNYVAALESGLPLGQVRFEISDGTATVSVSIDGDLRGRGYGSALIWRGCSELFASTAVQEVQAYVKAENRPSLRAFQVAGFGNVTSCTAYGQSAVHLEASREGWD